MYELLLPAHFPSIIQRMPSCTTGTRGLRSGQGLTRLWDVFHVARLINPPGIPPKQRTPMELGFIV